MTLGQSKKRQSNAAVLAEAAALYGAGKFREAEERYQRLLLRNPDDAEANNGMGVLSIEAGQMDFAIGFFERALRQNPRDFRYLNNLGNVLSNMGRSEEGLPLLLRAIEQRPSNFELLRNIGRTYQRLGLTRQALDFLDRALRVRPEAADAQLAQAEVLVSVGQYEEAGERFRRLVSNHEHRSAALYGLATSSKQTPHTNVDADIASVLEQRDLPPRSRESLEYAAAKIAMDLGRSADAWEHLTKAKLANAVTFDIERFERIVEATIRLFTPTFLETRKTFGSDSERPVFIVGMPRSGTSLTEQILSSHRDITGAGELNVMHTIANGLFYSLGTLEVFTDQVRALRPERAKALAQQYLDKASFFAGDTLRLTDKMPHNFMLIGLISVLFPHSKIIFCRRNPLDNCFSIYSNWLNDSHAYARDLSTLGRYYRAHTELMEHWAAALPNQVLALQYESLVDDLEGQARRVVAFLGLDWDPACLDYHKNDRAVATLSKWQVRQPIYRTSVERWRTFERYLDPLKNALGDLA